jgi:N6-L-threonylcarbamoyladenine synthase
MTPIADTGPAKQAASTPAISTLTVLGLETSCDETAAAVVRLHSDGTAEVVSDVVRGQVAEHALYGGVVPEIAARAHAEALDGVTRAAMEQAGIFYDALDGVAATAGPGLIGGVMVGLMTGKAIALAAGKPFVAVNHLEGHALSPRLSGPCPFPYLLLLVSGGHTQFLSVEDVGRAARLGSTIDDAAGEAFDKTAKIMGLGFPGGPALERAAEGGDPSRFALPAPFAGTPHCDFSFSGLKTAARRAWEEIAAQTDRDRADLAAAVQSAIATALADRAANAMARFAAAHPEAERRLVIAGGVAANRTVRARLGDAAAAQGFTLVAPPLKWCTDNAAMIALAGAERLRRGMADDPAAGLAAPARPRWPLDEASAAADPAMGGGRKGPKA